MTELPARRLAPKARWVWRIHYGLICLAAAVGVLIAGLSGVLALIPVAALVIAVTILPGLRWRAWRWDVRPEAIEIRRGVLRVRHTVVPMLRVQHVDTTSDLLAQAFALASVQIHTAADSHTIPLLADRDAEEVRRRIAALTDEP